MEDAALGGFPYKYHGEKFIKTVAAYWDVADESGYTIWQKLFNLTHDQLKELKELNFIYQGYSWKWGNSGYVWIYSMNGYEKSYSGKESNDENEVNYVEDGFDITNFASTPGSEAVPYAQFSLNSSKSNATWVVPYVFLLRNSQFQEDKPQLDQQECITTLSKSHFVWKDLGIITLQEDVPVPAGVSLKTDVRKGDYHVVLLAIYWQHDVVNIMSYPTRMLIDFTKDYINHSNNTSFLNPNRYWYRREITSREITFTDKGKEQTKYELVR